MSDAPIPLLDVLLHPIRLRVIQMLFGRRRLTARQMAREQPDIAQATLYRHLQQLIEAGVLIVAEERQVRNITEKVYALAADHIHLNPEDTVYLSHQQLLQLFTAFAALLINDFQRYLQMHSAAPVDFRREGVTFGQRSLMLTDDETRELMNAIETAVASFAGRPTDADRQARLISLVMVPATNKPGSDGSGPEAAQTTTDDQEGV